VRLIIRVRLNAGVQRARDHNSRGGVRVGAFFMCASIARQSGRIQNDAVPLKVAPTVSRALRLK